MIYTYIHKKSEGGRRNPKRTYLLKTFPGLIFQESPSFDDIVKKLTATDVLGNYKYIRGSVYDLIQPNDMRMMKQFQNLDFPANFFVHSQRLDFLFVEYFHSYFLSLITHNTLSVDGEAWVKQPWLTVLSCSASFTFPKEPTPSVFPNL